jgi:hypothetical protein
MRLKVNRMSRLDLRRESRDNPDAGKDGNGKQPSHPWRGEVELVFGEPIRFAWGTDHQAATERVEQAVAAL